MLAAGAVLGAAACCDEEAMTISIAMGSNMGGTVQRACIAIDPRDGRHRILRNQCNG